MNVEIGVEAALFPEKEYINGIAVAVHWLEYCSNFTPTPEENDQNSTNHSEKTNTRRCFMFSCKKF
jgi:hypothetical protein